MIESSEDVRSIDIISYYTGYICFGIALAMLIPATVSLIFSEWAALTDFIISFEIAALAGFILVIIGKRTH
ncbi:MAG: hypothetical protein ACYCYI_03080 [Saccharofermentanales bacterium]